MVIFILVLPSSVVYVAPISHSPYVATWSLICCKVQFQPWHVRPVLVGKAGSYVMLATSSAVYECNMVPSQSLNFTGLFGEEGSSELFVGMLNPTNLFPMYIMRQSSSQSTIVTEDFDSARSYAVFTAFGVAANASDVLSIAELNFTTPS